MSRRLKIARSLGAAVLLTHCVVANADFTPFETEAFNLSTSAFGFSVTNGILPGSNEGPKQTLSNLTFDKFDTGLGTLLGVEVTYASAFGSTITVNVVYSIGVGGADEDLRSDLTFTANGSQGLSLTGPAGALASSSQLPTTKCSVDSTDPPGTPDTCSNSASAGPTNFNSGAPISLTPLSDFFGPGTFVLTATLDSLITPAIATLGTPIVFAADNSTMTGTLATNWQGTVSVRYEFQPRTPGTVPEPMTLYLLLAGAAGMALLLRRMA